MRRGKYEQKKEDKIIHNHLIKLTTQANLKS